MDNFVVAPNEDNINPPLSSGGDVTSFDGPGGDLPTRPGALIRLDAFTQALVEAKTIPEVKNLADQADLFRQWLRKQRVGREAQNTGAIMCLQAQRKLGGMLANRDTKLHAVSWKRLLPEGIEAIQSHRWQKLAEIPEDTFQEFIQSFNETEEEITTIALIRYHFKKVITPITEVIPFPDGKYSVIVCDPPWQYGNVYNPDNRRGLCRYPQMSLGQLITLDIPAATDCILWLWTTNGFMHEAYHLLEAWEFEPKTILTWFKERIGVGYWLRGETEHCLLAVKGSPKINHKAQSTHLKVKPTNHSRKPDEFYELVESLCGKATEATHLEMFAREPRVNWIVWGNEID